MAKRKTRDEVITFIVALSTGPREVMTVEETCTVASFRELLRDRCLQDSPKVRFRISFNGEGVANDLKQLCDYGIQSDSVVDVFIENTIGMDDPLRHCIACQTQFECDPEGLEMASPYHLDCGHAVCRRCGCSETSASKLICFACSRETDCQFQPVLFHHQLYRYLIGHHHSADASCMRCSLHGVESARLYCKNTGCDRFLCSSCCPISPQEWANSPHAHSSHPIVDISQLSHEELFELAKNEDSHQRYLTHKLRRSLDNLNQSVDQVRESSRRTEVFIHSQMNEMIDAIRKEEQRLLAEETNRRNAALKPLLDHRKRLGELLASITVVKRHYEELLCLDQTTREVMDAPDESLPLSSTSTAFSRCQNSYGDGWKLFLDRWTYIQLAVNLNDIEGYLSGLPSTGSYAVPAADWMTGKRSVERMLSGLKVCHAESTVNAQLAAIHSKDTQGWEELCSLAEDGNDLASMMAAYCGLSEPFLDGKQFQDKLRQFEEQAIPFLHKHAEGQAGVHRYGAIAQTVLADYYGSIFQVEPNMEKAAHFARKAVNQDEPTAMYLLHNILKSDLFRGAGYHRQEATKWLSKAAECGQADACFNTAVALQIESKDIYDIRALRFLRNGVRRDHKGCQLLLGKRYLYGFGGVEENLKKAYELFHLAAQNRVAEAEFLKAYCLQKGLGCCNDIDAALLCCLNAARLGSDEAVELFQSAMEGIKPWV